MSTNEMIWNVVLGILAGFLTTLLTWFVLRSSSFLSIFGSSYKLVTRLKKENISAFRFDRGDFRERLPTFLSKAKHSISIISVSLKVTDDEGGIADIIFKRINQIDNFKITISLLDPFSEALGVAAKSLNEKPNELAADICLMLERLLDIKNRLSNDDQSRLTITVHDFLPMGSAILLDVTPTSGLIQVETKLYKSARTDSFGYEVLGPSEFYTRNYRAWISVLDESKTVDENYRLKIIKQTKRG